METLGTFDEILRATLKSASYLHEKHTLVSDAYCPTSVNTISDIQIGIIISLVNYVETVFEINSCCIGILKITANLTDKALYTYIFPEAGF